MRDIFFKDFGWKLFSLLLAAFIWYTVHKIIEEPKAATTSPTNLSATLEVPVLIVATAADVHTFGLESNTVSVMVSGPPELMGHLQANQLRATVDLSGFNENGKDLTRWVDVSAPWGVAILSVEPAKLRVVVPKK